MGHFPIEQLLQRQQGLLAVWQLHGLGFSEGAIANQVETMREFHDGVYLSGHAPPTHWQTWKAATLTTSTTVLSDWSAASMLGMREQADRIPTTVRRPGSGGIEVIGEVPGRLGALKIRRSTTLGNGATKIVDDIASTTVPRTLLDLMPQMTDERAHRMVRDVLRAKVTTAHALHAQIAVSRGKRGVARLKPIVEEYGALPAGRARSDAEVLAVAILRAAGVAEPLVNAMVAGGEADLVWWARRLIIELDGPKNHLFRSHDARKQSRWEAAGFTVRRLPTDDVYDRPHLLLGLANDPTPADLERPLVLIA